MTENKKGGMGGPFRLRNKKASKLSGPEVMEIREKYASGIYTYNRLAREYHVTSNTISNIVNGITWQELPQAEAHEEMDEVILRSMRKVAEMTEPVAVDPTAAAVELGLPSDFGESLLSRTAPVMKPDAEIAARMAAYGVRPPVPKELIEQLASPVHSSRSTNERQQESTHESHIGRNLTEDHRGDTGQGIGPGLVEGDIRRGVSRSVRIQSGYGERRAEATAGEGDHLSKPVIQAQSAQDAQSGATDGSTDALYKQYLETAGTDPMNKEDFEKSIAKGQVRTEEAGK